MKDLLNNKRMLYIGICVLVIGLAFAIGTYAYYSSTITGAASGQILAYTCTSNNTTSFTINDLTNMYPGYSATRTINLDASIYTNATVEVTSYTNMGTVGSSHPNLAIYNDENHQNKMSAGTNIISTSITPGTTTSVPLYIYWPYEGVDTYSSDTPSASITITCNQGLSPDELVAAKLATNTCVAVTNASDLHTETCSQTSYYCYADGYTANGSKGTTTITYGSIWDGDISHLKAGDAFDCDINNNGVIDKTNGVSTERFYYVSDYFNTGSQTFDTDTGVLIYYKNFKNNAPSNSGAAYYPSDNWHGPLTAVNHLPLISGANAWRSDLLKTNTRAILAEDGSTHNATATSGGTLPTAFEYKNSSNVANAARLLTAQEVMRGCNLTQVGSKTIGELSNCNFLFEGTKYADDYKSTSGIWFETPIASNLSQAWGARGYDRNANVINGNLTNNGVRPAIEVAKTKLAH